MSTKTVNIKVKINISTYMKSGSVGEVVSYMTPVGEQGIGR